LPSTDTIIGPLIGAFAGVGLGILANELWRRKLANDRKSFFRNLLLHEIRKSIELLESPTVNLIPVDAWNSLVNSGDMTLFTEHAIDLSDIYFEIQNYNYEAKRVRDAVEEEILHPNFNLKVHPAKSVLDASIEREQVFRSPTLKSILKKTKSSVLAKLKAIEKALNSSDST